MVSKGRFSLDVPQAVRKLRGRQLSHPSEYLLKLVQAGVASGGLVIRLEDHGDHLAMLVEGASLLPGTLASLYSHLFRGGSALQAVDHLAVGVNAALVEPSARVEVVSHGPAALERLEATPAEAVCSQLPVSCGSSPAWAVRIWKPRSLMDRLFQPAELRRVLDRARHAPCSLLVNGQSLPLAEFGQPARPDEMRVYGLKFVTLSDSLLTGTAFHPHHYVVASYKPAPRAPWAVLVPREPGASRQYVDGHGVNATHWSLEPRGPRNGLLCRWAMGIRAELRGSAHLTLVHHGVELERIEFREFMQPGLEMVASAHELTLDLSTLSVVGDPAYEALLTELKHACFEMNMAVRRDCPGPSLEQKFYGILMGRAGTFRRS